MAGMIPIITPMTQALIRLNTFAFQVFRLASLPDTLITLSTALSLKILSIFEITSEIANRPIRAGIN